MNSPEILERKPLPDKGCPPDYFQRGGWVDAELRDLHPVALSSLNPKYDPEDKTSTYHAAGRYYRTAVLSLIFRALDESIPPSMSEIARLLNEHGVLKRRGGKWSEGTVRDLIIRCGVEPDFMAYRTPSNALFVGWMEDPSGRVMWCKGPQTLND